MAFDIYCAVTDRIIEELENGVIPWEKPWSGVRSGAISHTTGKPYSLINQMLLIKPGEYLTFKQCSDEGGKVKKGAKARMVVFWKMLQNEKKDSFGIVIRDANGLPVYEHIPLLRYYNVFHIDDCEGIQPKYKVDEYSDIEHIDEAEKVLQNYVKRSGVRFENIEQDRAYYSPLSDLISLPLTNQFQNSAEYYSTAFHEAVHSTGHKSRLNRFESGIEAAMFGSESYSKEELVAEIGACGLLNDLGFETKQSFRNSASYIQSWLSVLKNDKKFILNAASKAEKAIKMIIGEDDKQGENAE